MLNGRVEGWRCVQDELGREGMRPEEAFKESRQHVIETKSSHLQCHQKERYGEQRYYKRTLQVWAMYSIWGWGQRKDFLKGRRTPKVCLRSPLGSWDNKVM